MRNGGGGHWLVRMEWHPAGWSMCLPLSIFPCTINSRSSLLAPAYPGGPGKRAIKWLWCGVFLITSGYAFYFSPVYNLIISVSLANDSVHSAHISLKMTELLMSSSLECCTFLDCCFKSQGHFWLIYSVSCWKISQNCIFYSAHNARIASAVLTTAVPSVCPSVCLSHAGIVSKRRHVARCSLHCWIANCV